MSAVTLLTRCPHCHRRLGNGAACNRHPDAVGRREAESDNDPPAIVGYRDWRLIGAGGFARVFAARTADGEPVAIKLARRRKDPRVGAEEAALRRLAPRPSVPRLLDSGATESGHAYLVMDLVAGPSLAAWLEAVPAPEAPDVPGVLAQMRALMDAVAEVHAAGLVHRDLKPENALLSPGGTVLIDFGLARPPGARGADDATLTRDGELLGTAAYMAPEQCLGAHDIDERADIYALGAIFFELLTGRPPFVGDPGLVVQAHASRRPPRPSELAEVPASFDAIVERCLAKLPAARFPSVAAFGEALAAAAASAEPATSTGVRAPVSGAARQSIALVGLVTTASIETLAERCGVDTRSLVKAGRDAYVIPFAAESPRAGARAALSALERLGTWVRTATLHLAELRLRAGGALSGPALERIERWMATGDAGDGVWVTAQAAPLLPDDRLSGAPDHAGRRKLVVKSVSSTLPNASPLIGRQPLIDALLLDRDRLPALSTIVGEAGAGKSRLVDELEARLQRLGLAVARMAGVTSERAPSDASLGELARLALGLDVHASADAVRVRRAGADELGTLALLHALGLADPSDPRLETLLRTPGAYRQTVASAVAHELSRRTAPLALIVDDAQWLDPAALDALELATMGAAPLWVVAAALPSLQGLRATWGERANHHRVVTLQPLDPEAARQLLLALLHPVDYVPDALVEQLVRLTAGVPLHIVELARLLHTTGAVRRGVGGSWHLAADDVAAVSSTPIADRMAAQAIGGLPPPLVTLAQLCAVAGVEVARSDLDAVNRLLPTDCATDLDVGVGIERLVRHGLMRATGDAVTFRHPMVRDAVAAAMPVARRRALHEAFRRHLAQRTLDRPTLERLARHTAAAGAVRDASYLYVDIGDEALATHRYVAADQSYSSALGLGVEDAHVQRAALAGRGRVRYRIERMADALADLTTARQLAHAQGDAAAEAELLLDEATALDHAGRFAESAAAVEAARALLAATPNALACRLRMGLGRSHWRAERLAQAIDDLAAAAEMAGDARDHETRIISLLLLAPALVIAGRDDEAERVFADVIADCERTGDRLHLGAAHGNRLVLWIKRQDDARAIADLNLAIALAREVGFSQLERAPQYNLAELMHWRGDHELALAPALRSRQIQLRLLNRPGAEDSLLLARIHCARREVERVRELLDWIDRNVDAADLSPSSRTLMKAVTLAVEPGETESRWQDVVDEARKTCFFGSNDELLETLWLYRRSAHERGVPLSDAFRSELTSLIASSPRWRSRFAE
jgi:eukaryotic-like serine/threonine-protein kinase